MRRAHSPEHDSCRKHKFLCKTHTNDTSTLSSPSTLSFPRRSRSQKMRHAASVCVYLFAENPFLRCDVYVPRTNTPFIVICDFAPPPPSGTPGHLTEILEYGFVLTATQIFIIFILRIVHSSHAAIAGIVFDLGRTFRSRLIIFRVLYYFLCFAPMRYLGQQKVLHSKFMLRNYFIHLTHCHKSETTSEQATDETIYKLEVK